MRVDLSQEYIDKLAVRFWNKVDKSGDCWLWTGAKNSGGYGDIVVCQLGKHRHLKATHVSLFLENGVWPEKLFVCHRCDNPSCVRPDHLFLGNGAENSLDMSVKRRPRRETTPPEVIRLIRELAAAGVRHKEIAEQTGIPLPNISGLLHYVPSGKPRGRPKGSGAPKVEKPKGRRGGRRMSSSSLTETDVYMMRKMHAEDGMGYKRLAKRFGVGRTTVKRIIRLERWKDVA